ncbi:minor capsid protein [Anaerobacillus sp. CMMVII]|uniref:minor capsid protein n=1 Tax=Anaerobacillus sp. CMMVII TaxID=2755588 RepID=UPI0021B7B836|nr:minor capsid protein [Anaerobacillus sp. CMMVII]MCT8138641.1 minor capsid protein [Anaerobacillus sp. CMMVII]
MSRLKPIPKKLLIHTVKYEEYLGSSRNGDIYADEITVNHVLIHPSFQVKRTIMGDDRQIKAVIFIDHKHSKPFAEMKPKSKVHFKGKDWIVNACAPIYAFSTTPHHYEVELI